MTKPKTFTWFEGSHRELLEWIDARKGPDSELILHNKDAIRSLKDSLVGSKDGREKYDFGQKDLPMTEIRRKLDLLWSHKLPRFKSCKIDDFYRQGSIALDWTLLGQDVLRDYTKEEIRALKNQHATSVDDSDNEPGGAGASTDAENGTGQGQPTESGSAAETDDSDSSDRPSKRPRLQENGADPEVPVLGEYIPKKPAGGPRSLSSYGPYLIKPRQSVLGGLDPLPVDAIDPKNTEPVGPAFRLTAERTRGGLPEKGDSESIQGTMDHLARLVREAISIYLHAIGMPRDYPTILDQPQLYPTGCIMLLRSVLGYDGWTGSKSQIKKYDSLHTTRVPWVDFLQSLVGRALTEWCFRADDMDEGRYYYELGNGNVREVMDRAFEPQLRAEVRQRLWRVYLDRAVKPRLEFEAYKMALMMETYVKALLPSNKHQTESFVKDDHAVGVRGTRRLAAATEGQTEAEAAASLPFKFQADRKEVDFRERIAKIFNLALHWRTEMSMRVDESLTFSWISLMEEYDSSEVKAAIYSYVPNLPQARVKSATALLCMMPIVHRCIRKYVGENQWGDDKLVVKGRVLRLVPKKVPRATMQMAMATPKPLRKQDPPLETVPMLNRSGTQQLLRQFQDGLEQGTSRSEKRCRMRYQGISRASVAG